MACVGEMPMGKCTHGKIRMSSMKCILLRRHFGMGVIFAEAISPRRDERLRPLRGIPAAPPKSLAFGRGRRHNYLFKWNIFLGLFREDAVAPVRGVVTIFCFVKVGKCLVYLHFGKGTSNE